MNVSQLELDLAMNLQKKICTLPVLPYHSGQSTFFGRIELLDQIHSKFSQHHQVILHGIGGIGKT